MARTPIHPGEILGDELKEICVSAAELARLIGVPANRVSQIIAGKRAVSADTALRLGRYFGTSPEFWMNLQKAYELDLARQKIGKGIMQIPQRDSRLARTADAQRCGDRKRS
jgi:addiction module HigA family antidote